MKTDEDEPQSQGGNGSMEEGGIGRVGVTHEEKMLGLPLTWSNGATGFSDFSKANFY